MKYIRKAITVKWVFGGLKKQQSKEGVVGIHLTSQGIAMAYLEVLGQAKPKITAYSYQATQDKTLALRRFVLEHNLQGLPCHYVLPSPEYTLTMVDTPTVTKEEMNRAMQWLVREFINFPIEEAVIDNFEIPLPRARDNVKMSYVAVIRKSIIPKIEELIHSGGLTLKTIDIPELALRNIVSLTPEDAQGTLLVYLHPFNGKLIICREGNVYISRSLELRLESLASDKEATEETKQTLELLSLEIQRSLDYSSATFRQSVASTVLLAPTLLNNSAIQQYLATALGMEIKVLDLASILEFNSPSISQEVDCLLAIGAVLRDVRTAA